MAEASPAAKTFASLIGHRSLRMRLAYLLLIVPVTPLSEISGILQNMFITFKFRQILRRPTNLALGPNSMSTKSNALRRVVDDILVILFGINQPGNFLKCTRIVASTYVVLGMSDSTRLPLTHIDAAHSPVKEDNMADALTLGHKLAENSCLMVLNEAGKLALLQSDILPNYKQLQFLGGRSGIATVIIGVQTIGYITSIIYRAIHHLPVSRIEAIGFPFSMLVIVHSIVHSMGVICQNPLLIYLNPTQETDILDKCKSTLWSYSDDNRCENVTIVGMVVVGNAVVALNGMC